MSKNEVSMMAYRIVAIAYLYDYADFYLFLGSSSVSHDTSP